MLTCFDNIIFLITLLLKWCPIFDSSPLHQFSKFNNFLWVCWFLGKNLANFAPPTWKLDNPYYHNMYYACEKVRKAVHFQILIMSQQAFFSQTLLFFEWFYVGGQKKISLFVPGRIAAQAQWSEICIEGAFFKYNHIFWNPNIMTLSIFHFS